MGWYKLGIGNARIYFSGTNLLTWAAYDQYENLKMSGVEDSTRLR